MLQAPKLTESASGLQKRLADWVMEENATLDAADLRRAQQLIRQLAAGTKGRAIVAYCCFPSPPMLSPHRDFFGSVP